MQNMELSIKTYGQKNNVEHAIIDIKDNKKSIAIHIEPYLGMVYINTAYKKDLNIEYMLDDLMGIVMINGFVKGKRFDNNYDDNDRYYERKKEEKAIEDAKKGVFYVMKED
jgi:hypothetical protein